MIQMRVQWKIVLNVTEPISVTSAVICLNQQTAKTSKDYAYRAKCNESAQVNLNYANADKRVCPIRGRNAKTVTTMTVVIVAIHRIVEPTDELMDDGRTHTSRTTRDTLETHVPV